MKLLFLGNERNQFSGLVDAINAHTDHEALNWKKLMKDEGGEIIPCPMTDPDVVICLNNYVTCKFRDEDPDEDLQRMGITTIPWRLLYTNGGSVNRGGGASLDWRMRDFNDLHFSQTSIDKDYFGGWRYNVNTGEQERIKMFPNLKFLPLFLDVTQFTQVTLDTSELIVGQTHSARAHAGAYSKGFDWLKKAHDETGCKLNIIFGRSHVDALAAKQECNLIFDNPWGNIGVTGLESMAQGIPVIGNFPAQFYTDWAQLSNGVPFPALTIGVEGNTFEQTQTQLNNMIQYYMDNTQELVSIGQQCYDWMHTYATPQKLAEFWTNKIEEAINEQTNGD